MWSAAAVGNWVESVGFPEYNAVFRDASIDGVALVQLTAEAMEKDPLLIASAEHRLVIEMELGELKLSHGIFSPKQAKARCRSAHHTQSMPCHMPNPECVWLI